jgi:hypothetical protein
LRAVLHPDVVAAVLIIVIGVLVTAIGLANVPAGWIIAGTFALTLVGILVGHALRRDVGDQARVRLLFGANVVLLLGLLVAAGYVRWWDPNDDTSPVPVGEFVLDAASETQCVNVSGEPGGEPLLLAPDADRPLAPICGAATHTFDCRSPDTDGEMWLRLAGSNFWLPAEMLRPRVGSSVDELPAC